MAPDALIVAGSVGFRSKKMTVHDRRLKALRAEERARVQTEKVRVTCLLTASLSRPCPLPVLFTISLRYGVGCVRGSTASRSRVQTRETSSRTSGASKNQVPGGVEKTATPTR